MGSIPFVVVQNNMEKVLWAGIVERDNSDFKPRPMELVALGGRSSRRRKTLITNPYILSLSAV